MTIKYTQAEVAEALEYMLRDKYLSTYKMEYVLETKFDTVNGCWITDVKVEEDVNVDVQGS